MADDLMFCHGHFFQSIYKDVQWSFEQNIINNICEYHIEMVGENIYGEVYAQTIPSKEQGIVFHKRIDTKGALWELQVHRFVEIKDIGIYKDKNHYITSSEYDLFHHYIMTRAVVPH